MKRLGLLTLVFALAGCDSNQSSSLAVTSDSVVAAITHGGAAEAENPTTMTAADYGLAPFVCKGTKFDIPSASTYGTFYICENKADADKLVEFYNKAGEAGDLFAQRVYRNKSLGVVLQLPQAAVDDATAAEYEAGLHALGE